MDLFDIIRDPTYVGSHLRTFTTSFGRIQGAERLDSNHFDPKYDELFSRMEMAGEGTVVRLGDWLAEKAKRGVQPSYDSNGEIFVINSQQVHADQVDLDSCSMTTDDLIRAKGNKGRIRKYDVLLNSTGYITIGRCQVFLDDVQAVVDSHVTILRPRKGLDPVYLAAFLNSRLGYLQTERAWTGSSGQIELRRDSIEEFKILLADEDVQRRVRECVESAHEARRHSRALNQEAIKAVESDILA